MNGTTESTRRAFSRLHEVLRKGDLPIRIALGMIEFEISGRDCAPFARQTETDVRAARLASIAYLFTGPRQTDLEVVRGAENFLADRMRA